MAPIVRLEPMDASNIDALKALRVREDQSPYIDPPDLAEFIDDAPHHPTFTVHAIRDDSGVVVGLVSFGFESDDRTRAWIPLLVVGDRYQRRGFGTNALLAVVDSLRRSDPTCARLGLSYTTGNADAARVYARLGFVPTGEPDERGDVTAWLALG